MSQEKNVNAIVKLCKCVDRNRYQVSINYDILQAIQKKIGSPKLNVNDLVNYALCKFIADDFPELDIHKIQSDSKGAERGRQKDSEVHKAFEVHFDLLKKVGIK